MADICGGVSDTSTANKLKRFCANSSDNGGILRRVFEISIAFINSEIC